MSTTWKQWVTTALCVCALAACNDTAETGPVAECDEMNTFDFEGARYCIVIEEGFLSSDCPDELPEGRDFADFTACTDGEDVPDEIEGEAAARGFIPSCAEGDTREDDCNTCTCTEGEWLCTTAGCAECEEGDTRMDDCNTCTCEGGEWACTEQECECEEGETRTEDCNDCVCEGGAWQCDTAECPTTFEECIEACADCEQPGLERVNYVAQSAEECALIDYTCPPGWEGFGNACGCGCVQNNDTCEDGDVSGDCDECTCVEGEWLCADIDCFATCIDNCETCEDPESDRYEYVGLGSECEAIDFACVDPIYTGAFSNECGCGCVLASPLCEEGAVLTDECSSCVCEGGEWDCIETCDDFATCLDTCEGCESPARADVQYVAQSAEECSRIFYGCDEGWVAFGNECGCGCILPSPCEPDAVAQVDCNTCFCDDSGTWSCTEAECECSAGETSERDCNTCTCEAGFFECTLEECTGCTGECADECALPVGAPVDITPFVLPEGCVDNDAPFETEETLDLVMHNLEDSLATITCHSEGLVDFDWDGSVLFRASFPTNPSARFNGVFWDAEADAYTVHLVAPPYCGGVFPPSTVLYFALPFGDETTYRSETCTFGECDFFFP